MLTEYKLHTEGDEEGIRFDGVAYAERMASVAAAGATAVSAETESNIANSAQNEDTEKASKPEDTGKPYMGGFDYRNVVH